MKIFLSLFLFIGSLLAQQSFYYSFGKKVMLTKLPTSRALRDQNVTFYENQNGQKIGVKQEVIIGCDDLIACKKVLRDYNITYIEELSKTIYLLKLPKNSDPFEISNSLYNEDPVQFAHPNFIKKRKMR